MEESKMAAAKGGAGVAAAAVAAGVVVGTVVTAGGGKANVVERNRTDCPVSNVTVYSSRAEVTRNVDVRVDAVQDVEIVVKGLPACVDTDSVRVDAIGHVTLQEVSYAVKNTPNVPSTQRTQELADIRQQAETLTADIAALDCRLAEVKRSQTLLTSFTDTMLSNTSKPSPASVALAGVSKGKAAVERREPAAAPREAAAVGGVGAGVDFQQLGAFAFQLLDMQEDKARAYNDRVAQLEKQRRAKQTLLTTVNKRLEVLGAETSATITSRDVTIVVTPHQTGLMELRLIYVVTNASWKPAYDSRMTTDSTTVNLTYFGMVRQNTGEDWTSAKLVLSTAKPSVGGAAPKLPTRHIRKQILRQRQFKHAAKGIGFFGGQERFRTITSRRTAMPTIGVSHPVAEAVSGGTSSTFHIARPMTINSDNKQHKVSVAVLRLRAQFRHYAVPALAPSAYLQCITTNNSTFTLLPSEQVNLFLDNTFVGKSRMEGVAPGETFRAMLGVDEGVRVEYRMLSSVTQDRGYFTKSQARVYRYHTRIKNTKTMPVNIILADILPRSDLAAVTVSLVTPTRAEVDAGTKMEEAARTGGGSKEDEAHGGGDADIVAQVQTTNNIVWSRHVAPGASIDVPFEYEVQHPVGMTVEMYDRNRVPSLAANDQNVFGMMM